MALNLLSNNISDIYPGILHTEGELSGSELKPVYDGLGNASSMSIGISGVSFSVLSAFSLSASSLIYPEEPGYKYDVLTQIEDNNLILFPLSSIICEELTGADFSGNSLLTDQILLPAISCGLVPSITIKRICDINNLLGVETRVVNEQNIPDNKFVTGISLSCGLVKAGGIYTEFANTDPLKRTIEPDKYYTLTTDKDVVDEGQKFTVRLKTVNVPDFEKVSYKITGVTRDDIENAPLVGSFEVINNVSTITYTTSINDDVEGVPNEFFKMELTNLPSYAPPTFAHVEIISDLRLKDYNRVCISIIDENYATGQSSIQHDFDNFVSKYPDREFHLIVYKMTPRQSITGNHKLKIPKGFANNPNCFIHGLAPDVTLTNNLQDLEYEDRIFSQLYNNYDPDQDWFNLANLTRVYRGSTIYFSVDNSGSTNTHRVRGQYNSFIQKCTARGIKAKELTMGTSERYFNPFNRSLPD